MKLPTVVMPHFLSLCLVAVLVLGNQCLAEEASDAAVSKDVPKVRGKGEADRKGPSTGGDNDESSGKSAGSREDHEKLRQLLGKVWDDPAVAQSREEVRVASENFRKVLHATIAELDPEAAELMAKMKRHSRSGKSGGDFGGGSRGKRSDGHRTGLDYMARPPFYASLDAAQRKIYDNAYQQAIGTQRLQEVMAEMRKTRQQDDDLRKQRTAQFVRTRKLLVEEMAKADPRVTEYFSRSKDGPKSRAAENAEKGGHKKMPPANKP